MLTNRLVVAFDGASGSMNAAKLHKGVPSLRSNTFHDDVNALLGFTDVPSGLVMRIRGSSGALTVEAEAEARIYGHISVDCCGKSVVVLKRTRNLPLFTDLEA